MALRTKLYTYSIESYDGSVQPDSLPLDVPGSERYAG